MPKIRPEKAVLPQPLGRRYDCSSRRAARLRFQLNLDGLLRQEVVLDGDLADLPAIGLEAADPDLDAAERNRVRRLRDQLVRVVDDAVAVVVQAVGGGAGRPLAQSRRIIVGCNGALDFPDVVEVVDPFVLIAETVGVEDTQGTARQPGLRAIPYD